MGGGGVREEHLFFLKIFSSFALYFEDYFMV